MFKKQKNTAALLLSVSNICHLPHVPDSCLSRLEVYCSIPRDVGGKSYFCLPLLHQCLLTVATTGPDSFNLSRVTMRLYNATAAYGSLLCSENRQIKTIFSQISR